MASTIWVIGGGVAGLAVGWLLRARGRSVVVAEAADRPGGVIRTSHRDGLRIEHGPQSLRGGTADLWSWIEAVGLAHAVVPSAPAASTRYLLQGGRLVALPSGPLGLLRTPLLSRRARLRALAEPWIRPGGRPGESVYDLMARRLGAEAADRLGTPFVGGIFGGDPRAVECQAALPRLVDFERTAGSLTRGAFRSPRPPAAAPRVPFTFTDGLQALPDALARGLGGALRLNTPVTSLTRDGAGWRVHAGGEAHEAEAVVVAATGVDRLLPGLSADPHAHAPIAAIHLGWRAGDVPAVSGFGWLAHPDQTRDALGAIYVSSVFPGHAPGWVLLRVLVGGARAPGIAFGSDDGLVAHARDVVAAVHGWRVAPAFTHVARTLPGIPQYPPGHTARTRALAASGLHFVGWQWSGLGVPDQLAAARAVVDRLTDVRR